jgi:hypothetical protein
LCESFLPPHTKRRSFRERNHNVPSVSIKIIMSRTEKEEEEISVDAKPATERCCKRALIAPRAEALGAVGTADLLFTVAF